MNDFLPLPKVPSPPPVPPLPTRKWLKRQEAADYLGMSLAQFADIAKRHDLLVSRPSKQCPRYKVERIDAMMDRLAETQNSLKNNENIDNTGDDAG